jgi:hypothetical protein
VNLDLVREGGRVVEHEMYPQILPHYHMKQPYIDRAAIVSVRPVYFDDSRSTWLVKETVSIFKD